jgi:hypothetical protein
MGAYHDIVNSGNLRLIRNMELRGLLNQYVHEIAVMEVISEKIWDVYYSNYSSFLGQNFLVSEFGWDAPNPLVHDVSIQLGKSTPPAPFEIDAAAIRSREFWNIVYGWKVANTDQARKLLKTK